MIQRQHNVSEPIPPFYVRTLVNLESSVNNALVKEKEAKKKMNATNAKALTAMKQKIKRAIKEYETDVKKYLEVAIYYKWMFGRFNQHAESWSLQPRVHRTGFEGANCTSCPWFPWSNGYHRWWYRCRGIHYGWKGWKRCSVHLWGHIQKPAGCSRSSRKEGNLSHSPTFVY